MFAQGTPKGKHLKLCGKRMQAHNEQCEATEAVRSEPDLRSSIQCAGKMRLDVVDSCTRECMPCHRHASQVALGDTWQSYTECARHVPPHRRTRHTRPMPKKLS